VFQVAQGSAVRVLVDLSAECGTRREVPEGLLHIEREIARRLLDDASLKTLPVVFWNELIYALDGTSVETLFNTERAPENVSAPPVARNGSRRNVSRLMLRIASAVGRRAITLTPQRARPDARQSLLHARNALAAVLRPQQLPGLSSPAAARLETERLSTIVRPSKGHIIWTCGLYVDGVPLRHLAESKPTAGFRLASICFGVNRGCHATTIASDVFATRLIDLLDASDVVFCASRDVQGDLERFAVDTGRPTPNLPLLPLGNDQSWEAVIDVVRAGLRSLANN
jgi:hypothetical protein